MTLLHTKNAHTARGRPILGWGYWTRTPRRFRRVCYACAESELGPVLHNAQALTNSGQICDLCGDFFSESRRLALGEGTTADPAQ